MKVAIFFAAVMVTINVMAGAEERQHPILVDHEGQDEIGTALWKHVHATIGRSQTRLKVGPGGYFFYVSLSTKAVDKKTSAVSLLITLNPLLTPDPTQSFLVGHSVGVCEKKQFQNCFDSTVVMITNSIIKFMTSEKENGGITGVLRIKEAVNAGLEVDQSEGRSQEYDDREETRAPRNTQIQ